jgi:hypothetical protein
MKWYEDVLVMLAAISCNVMITVTSSSDNLFWNVTLIIATRATFTLIMYVIIYNLYLFVKKFITR